MIITVAAIAVAAGLGLLAVSLAAAQTHPPVPGGTELGGHELGDLVPDGLGGTHGGPDRSARSESVLIRALRPVLDLGARGVRRCSPRSRVELTRRRIVYAGKESSLTLDRHFTHKALAAAAGLVLGFLLHPQALNALLAAVLAGALLSVVPDVALSSKADARQLEIARALPDALDLLAITVEAGLGLEQALSIISERMPGALGDEIRRLLRELELGLDRRQALGQLRERTDVTELSAFVVALLQAEELGVSIGQVLKVQAGQTRLLRRQRAREQAAKTPVKILFPLVFGIFPALFVVTIGPGVISIVRGLFGH